jgi:hypothetical protein
MYYDGTRSNSILTRFYWDCKTIHEWTLVCVQNGF